MIQFFSVKTEESELEQEVRAVPRRSERTTKGIPPERFKINLVGNEEEWVEPENYIDMLKRSKQEQRL